MNTIHLKRLLPSVFAQRTDVVSDLWLQENICLERGKAYLIEANSGTGKSSLCSYIIGHRTDYEGNILFDEQDAQSLSARAWTRLRRRSLSLLWQDLRLFPELTAWENVQVKNRLTHHCRRQLVEGWFDRLGMAGKRTTRAGQLSYGQQQRVAFIRMLCQPTQFFLLDEPISHLDDANAQLMADILAEEASRQGAGIIVTSIGKQLPITYDQTLRL